MESRELRELRRAVLAFYKKHGRGYLPWRKRLTPYRVFVSEYMLQQTQVERVIPKFNAFIKHFSSFKALGRASLPSVFSLWQGLGYNRRAKYLRDAAKRVAQEKKGTLPNDAAYLQSLPGIGPYTAGAILAFSFGNEEPFVETNIRTVVIHHCFPYKKKVSDADILGVLSALLPKRGRAAREWYAALMDYGAHLKASGIQLNNRSAQYTKQKTFVGSRRQLRGAIMRELLRSPKTKHTLQRATQRETWEVEEELKRLNREGLITKKGQTYTLAH